MRNNIKRWIIAGAAAVMALGVLTACTKVTEKKEDAEAAAQAESSSDESEGNETQKADDADAQDAGGEDGTGAASGEEMKLEGRIEKIPEDSDDSFIIAKLVTEEGNGVSEIGDDPDGEKITVVHSIDTRFVKQTIQDGGAKSEEKEGTDADLQEGFLVEVKGSYNGESVFFASEIKIIEVVS